MPDGQKSNNNKSSLETQPTFALTAEARELWLEDFNHRSQIWQALRVQEFHKFEMPPLKMPVYCRPERKEV